MKHLLTLFVSVLILCSCSNPEKKLKLKPVDWKSRISTRSNLEALETGTTYLPAYSHIYHIHEDRSFPLTVTASIRNISPVDTVYLSKADYHHTGGKVIRQYIDQAIYIKPLETLEIVIQEKDQEGGSGANFIFDWHTKKGGNPPLFEAVMISTYGQQGISFITKGVPVINP
ncbi:MAG: DUF3124 domain-containing protein [Flavobacteriaceae bacterium]